MCGSEFAKQDDAVDGTKGSVPHEVWQELDHMIDQLREGEGPIFCVTGIWSMLPERSMDDDDFQGITGRTAKGLRAV